MRIGKVNWVNHADNPIMSVDVQPNGYRFVTGGGDNYVCVWNLLPAISDVYEFKGDEIESGGEKLKDKKDGAQQGRVSQQTFGEEAKEDTEMQNEEDYMSGEESSSDDGLSPEERLRKKQRDADFEKDIKLMEGLF